jgi:hypothetical protein
MTGAKVDDQFSPEEIALRMHNAVRRALNTPAKSLKKTVSERKNVSASENSRVKKSHRTKRVSPES